MWVRKNDSRLVSGTGCCSTWRALFVSKGLFNKTLRIRKFWIKSDGKILTVNLLIKCKKSVMSFCRNDEEIC